VDADATEMEPSEPARRRVPPGRMDDNGDVRPFSFNLGGRLAALSAAKRKVRSRRRPIIIRGGGNVLPGRPLCSVRSTHGFEGESALLNRFFHRRQAKLPS